MATITLNAKIIEIENKIPNTTNLATKAALNTKAKEIENKMPDTSHFINAQEFYKLTKISFDVRMKEAEKSFASKTEVDNALDLGNINRKKRYERLNVQVISLIKAISKMIEGKII